MTHVRIFWIFTIKFASKFENFQTCTIFREDIKLFLKYGARQNFLLILHTNFVFVYQSTFKSLKFLPNPIAPRIKLHRQIINTISSSLLPSSIYSINFTHLNRHHSSKYSQMRHQTFLLASKTKKNETQHWDT
jgi:hypothetical protein